jgi:hypothetical protein
MLIKVTKLLELIVGRALWLQGRRVTQMSGGFQKCREMVWELGLYHPVLMRRGVLDHLYEKEGEPLLTKSISV